MSANPSWLDRLSRATDYRDLQEIFTEIAAQTQSAAGVDPAELARQIDEAVRRLEAERAHDEDDLREIQARYDTFRADQRGVMGWFKRHMPFTETRRREGEHKGEVADQEAEIRADNLVIARAQMLKERFLGPPHRRLGARPAEWRARLDDAAASPALERLGTVLQELAQELERSQAFLKAIEHDLDAFEGAAFTLPEDRRRRDTELTAAHEEKAELAREVHDEVVLKQAALQQLAEHAAGELERTDSGFRTEGQHMGRLRSALGRAGEARTAVDALIEAAGALGKLAEEWDGLPDQLQDRHHKLSGLENQRADSSAGCGRKEEHASEMVGQHEAAQRELEKTQHWVAGTQRALEASQAEARDEASMPVMAEAPTESPLWDELNRAKAAAEAAGTRVARAAAERDRARSAVEGAQAALAALTRQRDGLRDQIDALERRRPELTREMHAAIGRIQTTFAVAASSLGTYLASDRGHSATAFPVRELGAGEMAWLGPHGLERPVIEALIHTERDYQSHLQAVQLLKRGRHWLDEQRSTAEHDLTQARDRRDAAWRLRCRALLGDDLAHEACAHGLPD